MCLAPVRKEAREVQDASVTFQAPTGMVLPHHQDSLDLHEAAAGSKDQPWGKAFRLDNWAVPKRSHQTSKKPEARGPNSQGQGSLGMAPLQSPTRALFPHLSGGDDNICLPYCQQLPGTLLNTSVTLYPFILPNTAFTDKETKGRGQAM